MEYEKQQKKLELLIQEFSILQMSAEKRLGELQAQNAEQMSQLVAYESRAKSRPKHPAGCSNPAQRHREIGFHGDLNSIRLNCVSRGRIHH